MSGRLAQGRGINSDEPSGSATRGTISKMDQILEDLRTQVHNKI
jgi:hypothetical protein